MQLLSRLTKDHAIAERVLAAKGHVLILELPPAAWRPELEPYAVAIFKHILEDPVTLQASGMVLCFALKGIGEGGFAVVQVVKQTNIAAKELF